MGGLLRFRMRLDDKRGYYCDANKINERKTFVGIEGLT
jgi:hypothetical protein